jgi:tRNA uridine 5-carboxymethylaminomethyl modification enzyme
MHIGSEQQVGGRAGEPGSMVLSSSLQNSGLELGRLKTGTPPRLAKRSVDFSVCEPQAGDEPVPYFSYWKTDMFHMEHSTGREVCRSEFKYPAGSVMARIGGQLPCYLTRTTPRTATLIRENLHKSPMYSGVIDGIGPRYCPSIEDKIVKFADKDSHQVFLEPEGVSTEEIYVNGCSTCLPFEVQQDLVRTIVGCEQAEIMRPAYAVEYDFVFPTQLHASLETKVCRNLYLAGQINGTSGYEEAAAQGLMAGINAARRVQARKPIVLRRDQAYIGVLIDDLITKGTKEPYRMFTSRAEYRLLLRQDNADMRLSDLGFEIGLLPARNHKAFIAKRELINEEIARLEATRVGKDTLAQLLRRPEISYADLPSQMHTLDRETIHQVETDLKYAGYVLRQDVEVSRMKALESKQIPATFDYQKVIGLSTEAKQKLDSIRPATIGQAVRISGISSADVGLLLVYLSRGSKTQNAWDTYV